MNVILIRHGMTQGNINKKFNGCRTNEPLALQGIEKLKKISYPKADIVYVSPMKRCMETANIIYPQHSLHIVEDLREIDFGIFENKNHQELNGNKEYQNWLDSKGLAPIPQGESFDDFKNRCSKAFIKTLENENNENIAFVVHGGTIMALLNALGGYDFFYVIADNGKGYICSFENNKLKVENKL